MTKVEPAHVSSYRRPGDPDLPRMIGLSVAIGRFIEALFWAILRVAGTVTVAVFAGAVVLLAAFVLLRRWRRKRRV